MKHENRINQRNPKSVKHENRHKHVISSEATGLEIHKQTWRCFLATTGNHVTIKTLITH